MSMFMSKGYIHKHSSDLTVLSFLGSTVTALTRPEDGVSFSSYTVSMPPGGQVEPSFHKVATELIFVVDGNGTAKLGGSLLNLERHDVLIVSPPTPHSFQAGQKGLVLVSFLSSLVNSKHDFYSCSGEPVEDPLVLRGEWNEIQK